MSVGKCYPSHNLVLLVHRRCLKAHKLRNILHTTTSDTIYIATSQLQLEPQRRVRRLDVDLAALLSALRPRRAPLHRLPAHALHLHGAPAALARGVLRLRVPLDRRPKPLAGADVERALVRRVERDARGRVGGARVEREGVLDWGVDDGEGEGGVGGVRGDVERAPGRGCCGGLEGHLGVDVATRVGIVRREVKGEKEMKDIPVGGAEDEVGGLLIVAAGEVRVDVDGRVGGLELELGGRVELATDG